MTGCSPCEQLAEALMLSPAFVSGRFGTSARFIAQVPLQMEERLHKFRKIMAEGESDDERVADAPSHEACTGVAPPHQNSCRST
jgi:hypothetical protein